MTPAFQFAQAVAAQVHHFAHQVPQVSVTVPIDVSVAYMSITTHHCHPPPPHHHSIKPHPPFHPSHHLLSITPLVLFIVFAHINIIHPFHPAHQPYQPALPAELSVPPPPEPDGHLYCVAERLKLAGFVNAQIACTEL